MKTKLRKSNHSLLAQIQNQKGVTLTEVVISAGLVMIVGLVMSSTTDFLFKEVIRETDKLGVGAEVKIAHMRLQEMILSAGGAAIRPHQAILVENDMTVSKWGLPVAKNSDWIHLIHLQTDITTNVIIKGAAIGAGGYDVVSGEIEIDQFLCCPNLAAFIGTSAVLVQRSVIHPVWIKTVDTIKCTLNSEPYKHGQILSTRVAEDFKGGEVVPVYVTSYYLDPSDFWLKRFHDEDNDGIASATEIQNISYGIRDFQIALGYDVKIFDGKIEDTDDDLDEWLFNSPLDKIGVGGLKNFKASRLTMFRLGILLAHDKTSGVSTIATPEVKIFDGPKTNTTMLAYSVYDETTFIKNRSLYIR